MSYFPPRIKRTRIRESERLRCPAHLAFLREHHCAVSGCMDLPIEAAHLRLETDGAMGVKPSDCWAIPLCRTHHQESHRIGEATFQKKYSLDWKALAEEFTRRSPAWKRMLAKKKVEG